MLNVARTFNGIGISSCFEGHTDYSNLELSRSLLSLNRIARQRPPRGQLMRTKLTLFFMMILLTSICWSDVYVKNKLFKGNVSGSGASTMVEAEPMLKALDCTEYQLASGQLILGESTIPTDGTMVSLKALTEALGAKMILNPELGTIDIYQGAGKDVAARAEVVVEEKPKKPGYMKPVEGWLTSWDKAARESERTNKPILINFTGSDWCGWCIKLKAEVFDTPAFKTWATNNVVLLEADFPRGKELPKELQAQNQKLAQQFRVSGYPSIIFADHQGKQIGTKYGYDEGGPEVWTKGAESRMKPGR
jgi:thiol-disulfide isomerase/thioredoxin